MMSTAFLRFRPPGGHALVAGLLVSGAVAITGCKAALAPLELFGRPSPRTADQLTPSQDRQILVFGHVLQNPSSDIDPQIRRNAAQELMAMEAAEALLILDDALRDGEPPVAVAVIEAMESSPEPVEEMLPAATLRLQDASGETLEKLTMVLPRYGPDALDLVAQLAHNREEPAKHRLGPIRALAAFRSRDSAVQLMALLDEEPPAPQEVIDATCRSLEQLTGLPYGSNPGEWRRWWSQLKNEPIEEWLRIVVQHLTIRTGELEQEIHERSRANNEVATRLAGVMRQLFVTLPVEEQLTRLPELLGDELAPMREFGLQRVERMLRDSERVPEPVRAKLAERLADQNELPRLRVSAARLLDDLNYPGVAPLVSQALAAENDDQIARGYLEILNKRASPEGIDSMLSWLSDPTAGAAAADALWAMITKQLIESELFPTVRDAARAAYDSQGTPAHARLLALVGETPDLERLEPLLDNPDPDYRRSVAEGFCWAGHREPLLRRAGNEELFPFVVCVLERGPADPAALRLLAERPPPEVHRQIWARGLQNLANGLNPAELLAADDMLASFDHVDEPLRATILARVATLSDTDLSLEQRTPLLQRLAELRIAIGAYQAAYELRPLLDQAPTTPELARLKFRAALLSGYYEEAVALTSDPKVWVEEFAGLIDLDPRTALGVRDEIERRFADQLEGESAALFATADQRLQHRNVTIAPSAPDPPG